MTYNCLFSVLTDIALVDETLDHAVAMAAAHDAHLDLLCLGVDRSQTGYYYAGASAVMLQETITRAQDEAEEIDTKVRQRLGREDIRWASDKGVCQLADLGRHVASRAKFSDLAILPQPYGEGRGAELEPAAESVLFDGRTPALIVPPGATPASRPERIVVAWNESAEALAAVRAALPLLTAADQVHLTIVDPPTHGPTRSDPGGMLSQYLARHGVKVEIDVLAKSLPRVPDILVRHATDIDADLMIMGAYGHSRFREAIFGGATRTMLEEAPLPVLMAH
ncbi:universal stress protein [Roseovarius sp. HI0049]|nr:universal stress protein [Roseovarius sp. HI0049]